MAHEKSRDKKIYPITLLTIKESEIDYSKNQIHDIAAEYQHQYPGLLSIFEVFRGRGYEMSKEVLLDTCRKISNGETKVIENAKWILGKAPEEIARDLWKIGFLEAKEIENKYHCCPEKITAKGFNRLK